MRKFMILLAVFSLLAAACTGENSADGSLADGEGGDDVEVVDAPVDEPDGPSTFEVQGVQIHPGGVQLQVHQMTFDDDATSVTVQFINGRDFDTDVSLGTGETVLIDAAGNSYTTDPLERLALAQDVVLDQTFEFEPADPADGPFRLRVAWQGDGEVEERNPSFEIDGLDPGMAIVPLPADFGVGDTAIHPFGLQLRVFGMAFTETSIGISAELINNGRQTVSFTSGQGASFIEDDLGNRYQLALTPGDYTRRIEDDESQGGVLVFAGRIHPDATSLSGVLNREGDLDGSSLRPRLEFGPYNLDGSTPASEGIPNPINEVQEFTHPNGAEFVMNSIEFGETGSVVNLVVENRERRSSIRLALSGRTFLVDDLGNQYALLPPPDNTSLEVAAGAGLEAGLSFPGPLALDASTIEVVFNSERDAEENDPADNGFPEVHFGPFPITRTAGVVGDPPAEVPLVTSIEVGQLEQSEALPLTLIFDEFNGRLVPGGVLLTLPQEILFDSGSSSLGSSSRDAISKIIQVTEFYAGDQMTIIGHTDGDGDDASNQVLSEQRAQSVVDALIAAGADAALTSAEGRGETEPVGDNETDEGKQANRRVDVFFATDKGLPE